MKVNGQNNKMSWIAYLTVCGIWGSNFLATRVLVNHLPPLLSSGIRFILAGLIILLFLVIRGKYSLHKSSEIKRTIIFGLLTIFVGNGLFVFGMQWVHSGEAALLSTTIPLFIGIIKTILPDSDRMSFTGWIGLLIGFGGVAALLAGKQEMLQRFSLVGSSLILMAAIFWALGTVFFSRSPDPKNVFAETGVQMVTGGVGQSFAGVMLGELHELSFSSFTFGVTLAYLFLIIFGGIIGFIAFNYLFQVWPAEKAGTYAYVTPVIALFLGAAFLGEPLNARKLGAALIILLGVYLVQISGKQKVPEFENKIT